MLSSIFDDALIELIGVVLDGPEPLGHIEFEFERPGLSLLYGKNGAGKSSILRALERMFRGELGGTWRDQSLRWLPATGAGEIHLRIWPRSPENDRLAGPHQIRHALDDLVGGSTAATDPEEGASYDELAVAAIRLASESALEEGPAPDTALLGSETRFADAQVTEAFRQLATARLLVLRPIGNRRFSAFLAARLDDTCPVLTTTYTDGLRQARELLDSDPEMDIGWSSHSPVTRLLRLAGTDRVRQHVDDPASSVWRALPLAYIGDVTPTGLVPQLITGEVPDIAGLTMDELLDVGGRFDDWQDEEGYTYDALTEVHSDVHAWSEAASELFEQLLLDAPPLELELPDPDDWETLLGAHRPTWRALDVSGALVELSQLSDAQQRLAHLAIGLTAPSLGSRAFGGSSLALLDEPERALHRRAEEHLVNALASAPPGRARHVVCATHSPRFLAHPAARSFHVHRDDQGLVVVDALDELHDDLEAQAAELGVGLPDLMQLYRVVVVVEGEHDKSVVEEVLGDELRQASALVLTAGGARQLPHALSAQLLLRFTEASVVVLVDNTSSGIVDAWSQASLRAAEGEYGAARRLLSPFRDSERVEERLLYELLTEALKLRVTSRVSVFGLEKRDIIGYLPPRALGLDADSWGPLEIEFRATRQRDFKEFLRRRGGSISTKSIRAAAQNLDYVPEEFLQLGSVLRMVARPRGGRRDSPDSP